MNSLWTPEVEPPQVTQAAEAVILQQTLEHGAVAVAKEGYKLIRTDHEPLVTYLDALGTVLDGQSAEGMWPSRILKLGASISALAYRETGYFHAIDTEALEAGELKARPLGIPEAYAISYVLDPGLQSLTVAVSEVPEFTEGAVVDRRDSGGFEQVMNIGAGCVRHYLQQAVHAA